MNKKKRRASGSNVRKRTAGERCSVTKGSVLWAIACVLTKSTPTGLTFTQTLSWRRGMSEDEARGSAVKFAMAERPDYAIEIVTISQIPSPNTKVTNSGAEKL